MQTVSRADNAICNQRTLSANAAGHVEKQCGK